MELSRRNRWVYGLLAAIWVLVVGWQTEEHLRVREAAKNDLRSRSKDIANTVSAIIRGVGFRGAVPQDRLEPLLNELVNGRTNELIKSSELISIVLLNATNQQVFSAGKPLDLQREDLLQQGEHWGQRAVILVNPVDLGASFIVPPRPTDFTNRPPEPPQRPFPRPEPAPVQSEAGQTNTTDAVSSNPPPAGPREGRPGEGRGRFRRPFWLRGMNDVEFQSLVEKNTLHGLVLAMSTEPLEAALQRDLWLRAIMIFLATLSALGCGVAWRNLAKSSELQIRLIRASELNTHLKEMNLAAAGLAHETRNPLNIIRGQAQLISKQPEAGNQIRQQARAIVDEADKVAAQLNEFINYSRPREVRRSVLSLGSLVNDVVRTLGYDLEEKKIRLQVEGEQLNIEADEQLLRQALFNLLLNAIQAVDGAGEIRVLAERRNPSEAALEVRDNGPGVPLERRSEIFKPYFTTQKKGTGLGLAVVQQIVLAHGWEIECLPNAPQGAIFRITHLKLAVA